MVSGINYNNSPTHRPTLTYSLDRRINHYRDCRTFLEDSGAIHNIMGLSYPNSGLLFDSDNHPLFRVEGNLVRWEHLKDVLYYDANWHKIRHRHTGAIWTYFSSEQGFLPIDRSDLSQLRPIHRLTSQENQDLLDHANKFFNTNPNPHPEIPKTAVLQIVSHLDPSNDLIPAIYERSPAYCFVHYSLRVIVNGEVYSFGIEHDRQYADPILVRSLVSTSQGHMKQIDYEEFRSYKRNQFVTSIPISVDQANHVFQKVQDLETARFCFVHQNCCSMTTSFVEDLGYSLPERQYLPFYLLSFIIPDFTKLPVVGFIIAKICEVAKIVFTWIKDHTPDLIKTGISFTVTVILYIPKKITTFACNLLILSLGGFHNRLPLPDETESEVVTATLQPKRMSALISSFSDMFNDDIPTVFHSQLMVDWQESQDSTVYYEHNHNPRLCVNPSLIA